MLRFMDIPAYRNVDKGPKDTAENKRRILAVDDETDIRIILSRRLKRDGYDCVVAANGLEALKEARKEKLDLVLLDINMPHMSGTETLARIKEIDQDLPVVMVSSVDSLDTVRQTLREGAYDYLVKPIDFEEFDIAVRRALIHGELLRENREYQRNLEKMVSQRTRALTEALEETRRTYQLTILALGAALETRDIETQTHSLRVAHYARIIALELGIEDEETLTDIERGAYLHDIGKIGVPDNILRKPASLTEEEWQIMRTHTEIGKGLIKRIEFLRGAAPVVHSHHERYDGTGYPEGLKGDKIPIGAKIFAVADALDAMTSERPYGEVLSFEDAKENIIKESGKQFDPKVVEAFSRVRKERFFGDIEMLTR